MKKWYYAITNKGSAHEQGLIIEEETGNAIAVSYDSKHAELISLAPELFEALKEIVECPDYKDIQTHEMKKARQLVYYIENK